MHKINIFNILKLSSALYYILNVFKVHKHTTLHVEITGFVI